MPLSGSVAYSAAGPLSGSVGIALGDSFCAQNNKVAAYPAGVIAAGANPTKNAGGIQQTIEFVSGGRVAFPYAGNFGVSGQRADQWLARLLATDAGSPFAVASALKATFVLVASGGTNDRGQYAAGQTQYDAAYTLYGPGATPTAPTGGLCAIRDLILGRGLVPVFLAPLPRGTAAFTVQRLNANAIADNLAVRAEMLTWPALYPGVIVLDLYDQWLDKASATADDMRSDLTQDGLHPNAYGAHLIANVAWAAIRPLTKAAYPPYLPASNSDVRGARNLRGSIAANPKLTGTSGAPGAAGAGGSVSGALPNGVSGVGSNGRAGLNITYSQEARIGVISDDARAATKVVITGTPTAANQYEGLRLTLPGAVNFPEGSQWVHATEMEWAPGSSGCFGLFTTLELNHSGGFTRSAVNDYGPLLPPIGAKGVLISEPAIVPPSLASYALDIRAYTQNATAISLTFWIWQTALRRLDA